MERLARFYIDGAAAGSAALANRGNNSTNGLSIGGQREQNARSASTRSTVSSTRSVIWASARSPKPNRGEHEHRNPRWVRVCSRHVRRRRSPLMTSMVPFRIDRRELATVDSRAAATASCLRISAFRSPPARCAWMRTSTCSTNIAVLRRSCCARRPRATAHGIKIGYLIVSTNTTNFHLYVGVSPGCRRAGSHQHRPFR